MANCKTCKCKCHCEDTLHAHHYDGDLCACDNCHEIRVLLQNREKVKELEDSLGDQSGGSLPNAGGNPGTRFHFASDDEDA